MGRTPFYRIGIIVLVICAIIPIVLCVAAVAMLPDVVPMHFDFSGSVNRWGSKYELFLVGGIMAAVNVMMLVFYVKAEALKRFGLLNAPGPDEVRNGRIILVAAGVIVDIIFVVVIIAIAGTAFSAA